MPKDPAENINQYKIRGGTLNEFDFHKNQEELSEQEKEAAEQLAAEQTDLLPGDPPQVAAQRVKELEAEVHEKAEKLKAKAKQK
jgi:hypothetical protein